LAKQKGGYLAALNLVQVVRNSMNSSTAPVENSLAPFPKSWSTKSCLLAKNCGRQNKKGQPERLP